MTDHPTPPATLRIDCLRISGGSGVAARRLAEALPAAFERALARWPEAPAPPRRGGGTTGAADRVAAQVVQAALARAGLATEARR